MSQGDRHHLSKRTGIAAAVMTILRAWLPSLVAHAVLISALGLVAFGVGQIGALLEQEESVAIVMREESESGEIRYREQQDVELTNPQAPTTPVSEARAIDTSVISSLDRSAEQDDLDTIGLGSLSGGGASGDFAAMGGGATGGAQFFGLRSKGRNFVFVVDRSGSMQGGFFRAAKRELVKSLRALPRGSRFHVMFFSSARGRDPSFVEAPAGRLIRTSASNLDEIESWIEEVPAFGGTDPQEALLKAMSLRPDAIFFLTDGMFRWEVVAEVTKANKNDTAIMAVSFNKGGEQLLKRLSANNDGKYRFVKP